MIIKKKYILPFLLFFLTSISGILGNIAANILPKSWEPYLWLSWPFFTLLTIISFILSLLASGNTDDSAPKLCLPHEQRNRRLLLNLVYNTWIDDVLQKSSYKEAHLNLKLKIIPDLVKNPWDSVIQIPGLDTTIPTNDSRIMDFYQKSSGSLLILGEPGSGKSTILLELAREAIECARKDPLSPIPIVVNLSSWTHHKSIVDWLIDELYDKYYVSRKVSRYLVEQNELLLLLDGLDEVELRYRDKCILALNHFSAQLNTPFVICSRKKDYENLQTRLRIRLVVLIQPLTTKQVVKYLKHIDRKFVDLYERLHKDQPLREFLSTPLTLSVLIETYRYTPVDELEKLEISANFRDILYDSYIKSMFERRRPENKFSPEKTITWLRWLATRMIATSQSIFYIENISEEWFRAIGKEKVYRLWKILMTVLIFQIVFVANLSFFGKTIGGQILCQVFGLFGWLIGLFLGLIFSFSGRNFKPSGKIIWSWNAKKIVPFLYMGLFMGVWLGLLVALIINSIVFGILGSSIYFLGILLLIGGLGTREIQSLNKPEQGVQDSVKNFFVMVLVVQLISISPLFIILPLLFYLDPYMAIQLRGIHSFFTFLFYLWVAGIPGLLLGFLFGIKHGGGFLINHFLIRWFLFAFKIMPFNYTKFLDNAVDRIFIRKVGGGYMFIHRTLMDHFAKMDPAKLIHTIKVD